MSRMLLFSIKDLIEYERLVELSNALVQFSLKIKKGIIFNFLGYGETIIKDLTPCFYFSISDDFFQLNCEYLTTEDIQNIESCDGENAFIGKFTFLDEVYDLLKQEGVKKIEVIISCDGGEERIENFKLIKKTKPIAEILYDEVLKEKDSLAYDFPEIVIY